MRRQRRTWSADVHRAQDRIATGRPRSRPGSDRRGGSRWRSKSAAAYAAEFVGTFLLVLFIGFDPVVEQPGAAWAFTDFAVIGLRPRLRAVMLVATLGGTSGAHFNPAVTVALAAVRQISPGRRGDLHRPAARSARSPAALVVKLVLDDAGRGRELRRARAQRQVRQHEGRRLRCRAHRHVRAHVGDHGRGGQPARRPRLGAVRHRRRRSASRSCASGRSPAAASTRRAPSAPTSVAASSAEPARSCSSTSSGRSSVRCWPASATRRSSWRRGGCGWTPVDKLERSPVDAAAEEAAELGIDEADRRRTAPAGRAAAAVDSGPMRRRVTFSRNFTLSLSRTCQCYCKYCAFATHQAHLHAPDEVEQLLDGAARRGVKELLVLTGERPGGQPRASRARLARVRATRTSSPTSSWACERALERGMLPHTNLGVLSPRGPRAAARGDRLAGADARVGARRPRRPPGLADQGPRARGWRRSAPPASCGSRSRAASSSASARRTRTGRRARGAGRGARRARPPAGGHPPELRPAPRATTAQEPAEIADEAARRYWRTGLGDAAGRVDAAGLGDARSRSRT